MKALVLDKRGSLQNFRMAEVATPEPATGEVRICVHAVGLNPVDYKLVAMGYPTWSYPFILGLDVAGTIDAVGPDVQDWQVGDRVFYHGDLSRPGGYAEYTTVAAHVMARIPASVSFVEAAALPCAGFTAYQALFRKLHLRENQTILVHGGAGGVGGFAVQLAAYVGATVITTASAHNAEYVRHLGAHHVIDYRTENVHDMVMQLTSGRGVDAIVDVIGKASATQGLTLLAFGGGIACIERMPELPEEPEFDRAVSIHRILLGGAFLSGDRVAQDDLGRIGRELMTLVLHKVITPMLTETITLEAVPEALARLEGRHVRGKIVVQVAASDTA